jgi:hypothetical protein
MTQRQKIGLVVVAVIVAIFILVALTSLGDSDPCSEHHITSAAECLHKRYEER